MRTRPPEGRECTDEQAGLRKRPAHSGPGRQQTLQSGPRIGRPSGKWPGASRRLEGSDLPRGRRGDRAEPHSPGRRAGGRGGPRAQGLRALPAAAGQAEGLLYLGPRPRAPELRRTCPASSTDGRDHHHQRLRATNLLENPRAIPRRKEKITRSEEPCSSEGSASSGGVFYIPVHGPGRLFLDWPPFARWKVGAVCATMKA